MTTAPTRPSTQPRPVVSVEELRLAWRAVQAGQFRRRPPESAAQLTGANPARASHLLGQAWEPTEAVLPVLGCAGSVGASTLALALAIAAIDAIGPARVVECCTATASGLAAASTAELGRHPSGWVQGSRDGVLLERASEILLAPDEVPLPSEAPHPLAATVLDVGWEPTQLLARPSWLADQLLQGRYVVAVTTATIPGLRRLEGTLALLDAVPVVAAAVLGPRRRRWPRAVEHSMGALTRQLDQARRLHQIPLDRGLAGRGLDSEALPTRLLTAAGRLLHATGATAKGNPS